MTIPAGITTVVVSGRYIRPDGTPLTGTIAFEPPARLTFPDADTISAGAATVALDDTGAFAVALIATDVPGMQPKGWTYTVTERMARAPERTYAIVLPAATPAVDLADIAPADPAQGDYVLVEGPAGKAGSQIYSGTGAPSPSLGVDGDYYVDSTTSAVKLYGPKAAGAWSAGVALGGGGGAVSSVNSRTGAVVLNAADVGADPAGSSASALASAQSYTDTKVSGGGLTQATADARYALLTRTSRNDLGIYAPPGWGSFWRAKRAATGTGRATVAVVGGSASQGMYASNPITKSWPGVVRTALQASYGDGGSGFHSTSLSSTILAGGDAAALANWTAQGAIVAQTGTWVQSGNKYGPGLCGIYTETTGDSLTFSGVRGTTVKIYTVSGGTRPTFTYSIDGGTAQTVTQTAGAAAIQVTTVNVSAGTHTVKLTCGTTTAGQYLTVVGVEGTNATGVVVNNLAMGGASSASYANNTTAQLNSTWNGGVDYPADLVIYTAGPNDATQNTAGDVWAANVAKYLKAVRDTGSATGATDVVIMLPHLGTFDTTNYKYQDFAVRARTLAEVYGAAFVNMWAVGRNSWEYWRTLGYWGTSAGTGAAGTDSVHLSDAGFAFMANTVLPLLTA